jgi:DNA-binding transcriptional regulator YiaG
MSTLAPSLAPLTAKLQARRELPSPAARRALRTAAGVSQEDVARAIGVTRQCISWWEAGGRTPSGENLTRYVAALDEIKRAVS